MQRFAKSLTFENDLQNSKERKLQLQISEIAHANRLDSANTNVEN
jgi:hypothetical protein